MAIEKREVIRLGDTTTHGGEVITGSSKVFYEGIPIARIGDKVTCPKCEGTHTIVEGAPTAFDRGKNIARHGDAVSCGAKLIARTGSKDIGGTGPDNFAEELIGNRYFIVVNENDTPMPMVDYVITDADGTEYSGETDENGHTATIFGKVGEKMTIRVLVDPDYETV